MKNGADFNTGPVDSRTFELRAGECLLECELEGIRMFQNKPVANIGLIAAMTLAVSACTSGPVSRDAMPVIPATSKDRSVVVVRVFHDQTGCNNGAQVRLAPVIDGQIDTDHAVIVSHDITFTTSGRLKPGTTIGRASPEETNAAYRQVQLENMRRSFTSIPPGDYVVTHVQCTYRNGNGTTTVDIGGGNRTGWAPSGAGASTPVLGDSFIRIPPDRVVDTGVLFIRTTEAGGWFTNGKGRLEGRAVGDPARASLREEFPTVYTRAVFSNFSKMPGMSQ